MARSMPKPTTSPFVSTLSDPQMGEGSTATRNSMARPTAEQIARRAYELFEARGRQDGNDMEDWLQAERELRLGRR
ncbi:MAG: DUF2934 domain-containing protein [Myxococcaceae bacterium]|nr:DUF2934 domain-containing protein [Myxococcaceae bacterium]MCI0672479.1 DUF2934 domain-containing protein [Myxococcaceae bacterium]